MSTSAAARPTAMGMGIALALLSAASFGTSGAFASSLISAGWTPALTVLIRVALGAVILLVPTVLALRGRWGLVWANRTPVLLYSILAVAGAQAFFFYAVQRISVGVALMLEYLAVVLVVLWMWLRHNRRPRRLTVIGSAVAVGGLAFVLDLFGGVRVDPLGVAFGLAAAVGLATFFLLSAQVDGALPPVAMAGTGMAIGSLALFTLGVTGVLQLGIGDQIVELAGAPVPWWVPMAALGVVAAAFSYLVGVMAARRLGATMASFIGLTEVLFAVLFAWALLGQLPTVWQLVGGTLIVGGVVLVRVDELRRDRQHEVPTTTDQVPMTSVPI